MNKCDKTLFKSLKLLIKAVKMPDQNTTSEEKLIKNPNYADILCGMGENRVMFRWVGTFLKKYSTYILDGVLRCGSYFGKSC